MNLAVGFFDGVHLGHRRILANADAAFTFRNHPATVFAPARAPALVMSAETRRQAIAAALRACVATAPSPSFPLERVRMVEFTREFADQTPAEFAEFLRREYPALETILCGPDWTFGKGGAGRADFLRQRGFKVETVDFVEIDGVSVSSTRIRAAIAAGDLATVRQCLGRPWRVEGEVRSGKGLGRQLGFPTLNLQVPSELVRPPCGVYAVDTQWGRAIANWGLAPTLGEGAWREPTLEVHLLDSAPVLAPSNMAVDFLKFIRPERTFSSLAALQAQIAEDVTLARD